MEMEKKNLAIIILAIVLAASGIGNIILGVQLGLIEVEAPEYETFTRAVPSGPSVLDHVDQWEQAANEVCRQVVETLYYYNWSDEGLGRINMLAESETWLNSTAVEITIRSGISFHDGTPLTAEAVKWNIDRMLYLFNHTGELPSDERRAGTHSLYEDPTGAPLIENCYVSGSLTVVITLYNPFSTLLDLLCWTSGAIVSPTAHAGDEHSFIDLTTGDLVGTGFYEYDEYIAEQEVRFTRNDDYWGGPQPHEGDIAHFEKMVYVVIDDPSTRNYALLAHDVDWLAGAITDLYDTFNASPTIDFVEMENAGLGISYLGFNNRQINVTYRKAMLYCFNYTYMVDDYWQGRVFRSYGWVSPGYGDWYDAARQEDVAPYYNVTIARMILLGEDPAIYGETAVPGLGAKTAGRDPLDDADWLVADGATEIGYFNYSYNTDNQWRADLYTLLNENFADIGITIEDGGTDWAYFIYRAYGYVPGGYDQLQLYWVGWGPDYLDPINMIQPLISNVSLSNSAQVNDADLEQMFVDYFAETDDAARYERIKNISYYCITELHSHMFGFHAKGTTIHGADIYWDVDDKDAAYGFLRYDFYAYSLKRNASFVWD